MSVFVRHEERGELGPETLQVVGIVIDDRTFPIIDRDGDIMQRIQRNLPHRRGLGTAL
jgi:hypothetical protein